MKASEITELRKEVADAEREVIRLSGQIRELEGKLKAANRRYTLADQALIRAEATEELNRDGPQ